MSGDYDSVMALVGEVAAVWTVVVPRLGALEATVAELEAAADAARARRPNDLASARRAIGDAGNLARTDPLAVSDDVLTTIAAMVERASTSLRASLAVRHELDRDLMAARACLDECAGALERPGRRVPRWQRGSFGQTARGGSGPARDGDRRPAARAGRGEPTG